MNEGEHTQQTFRLTNGIVHFCQCHVFWCTKYRREVLGPEIAERLEVVLRETADELGARILACEIQASCVRLHLDVEPKTGIHRTVKRLKGRSAGILREEYPQLRTRIPSLWTNEYLVSSSEEFPAEEAHRFTEAQQTSQRNTTSSIIEQNDTV